MIIKYMHIRTINDDGKIQPCGGVTIAYIPDEANGLISAAWTKCRDDELFCYKTGREQALAKLQGRDLECFEVLDLAHPISETIADWIATDVWPNGKVSWGMGYGIDVERNSRFRWGSTFCPSQLYVEFEDAMLSPVSPESFEDAMGHEIHAQ